MGQTALSTVWILITVQMNAPVTSLVVRSASRDSYQKVYIATLTLHLDTEGSSHKVHEPFTLTRSI